MSQEVTSLEIHEWEIWHTYTSYLTAQGIDLGSAARRLVESEVALCAVLRDGRMYWRSGEDVGAGWAIIEREQYADQGTLRFEPDAGRRVPLDGFAAECWAQACEFRFGELRVFGEDRPLPPPYVRAFLGQCNMVSNSETPFSIALYPVLLIYETGVLILELRVIGPESPMALETFISDAENLFRHAFDLIEVSPGLSKLATRAYYHRCVRPSVLRRTSLTWLEKRHDRAVDQLTRSHEERDFEYDLAPLSPPRVDRPCENLSGFALTVFNTVGFILSRPRSGASFILRGQKQSPELGNFWSGRPHMYLTKFKDQCDVASENQKRHGEAFKAIMARVPGPLPAGADARLPEDSRMFDDFNAYIGSAASLWVWSRNGLEKQFEWKDPNRGHLIYQHQAVLELMEYGYMLHRALLERVEQYSDPEKVIAAQKDVLDLKLQLAEASHFGEIRDLLEKGWKEFGLPELRDLVQDALRLRESRMRARATLSTARVGQALTILFGLMAAPGLATEVIQPLWELLSIWHPKDPTLFRIEAEGISFALVALLVVTLIRWLGFKEMSGSN